MVDAEITAHYALGQERERLFAGGEQRLELVRTLELLDRLLPPPPAFLVDVGGGPGTYATIWAGRGYTVHLYDAVALHVEQAGAAAAAGPSFEAAVADARAVPEADGSADAVLLLGPLYHLTEAADRVAALREAWRVVRPGGVVAAVGISRYAALLDGLARGWLGDPTFRAIAERDVADGQHRNPDVAGHPDWFTTAYFHRVDELAAEVRAAGFEGVTVYGIEGPGWLFQEHWGDPDRQAQILLAARAVEAEPVLSSHLLAVGRRPAGDHTSS